MTRKQAEFWIECNFWMHLASYLAAVIVLAVFNIRMNPANPWILWVASLWGVLVSLHASLLSDASFRQWMIDRTLERWNRRWLRARQHDLCAQSD